MNNRDWLLSALQYYAIEILSDTGNCIKLARGYEIEMEANGMYKLLSDGQVVGPFNDADELCRFILL